YTVSGTAQAGLDYSPLSGSVTIPSGMSSAEILVQAIDDSLEEGFVNESVVITLQGIVSGDRNVVLSSEDNQATIGIIDNDPDDDADGIGSNIEDPGGQGFDGNRDGISDALQANVASLPNATNGTYVTIVSADGGTLAGVVATTNPSPVDVPAGVDFAAGFLEYEIQNVTPGGESTVHIFTAPGATFTSYYKYGPTPDNHAPHWYDFRFDGTTGAKFAKDRITLIYVDGMRGDDDLIANGVIVDPGGPAGEAPAADLPLAHAGGPYVTTEGSSITLDASQSKVGVSNGSLTYEWDLDYDGLTFDLDETGVHPTVSFPDNLAAHTIAVRVTDSTDPSKSSIATAAVQVFNLAPRNVDIASSVGEQVLAVGNTGQFSGSFSDLGLVDTHSAVWTFTHLDDQNESVTDTRTGTVSQGTGSGTVTDYFSFDAAGVYQVSLTVTDDDGGVTSSATSLFVVYDPSAGFVTGGGWIQSPVGAYTADSTLTGKANFGFNSKYKQGASVPTGNTEFQFKMADFNFKSTSYEWLVVSGAKARFRGVGTVNGTGEYGFELTAWDGNANGGDGTDRFRIKIWIANQGNGIVYDNLLGAADQDDPTAIGGGSIVIHKKSNALLAEGGVAMHQGGSALTQTMLSQAVDQVTQALRMTGIDAQNVNKLQQIHVEVADLPDAMLGISSDTDYVWIDRDAAGHGWQLDVLNEWSSSISDGMDLLSVIAHELGHKFGLEHSDDEHNFMAPTLAVGMRRLATIEEQVSDLDMAKTSRPSLDANVSRSSLQHEVRHLRKEAEEVLTHDHLFATQIAASLKPDLRTPAVRPGSVFRYWNELDSADEDLLPQDLLEEIALVRLNWRNGTCCYPEHRGGHDDVKLS
ncbi:MAG: matrixin family metalloprotease, partial [Planctomycetales bacterium]|nr:matrixin family metalloprotease [Planctomycetales bacterium]